MPILINGVTLCFGFPAQNGRLHPRTAVDVLDLSSRHVPCLDRLPTCSQLHLLRSRRYTQRLVIDLRPLSATGDITKINELSRESYVDAYGSDLLNSSNTSSARSDVPTFPCNFPTVAPALGDRMMFCIFIASTTHSSWPISTTSPSWKRMNERKYNRVSTYCNGHT